MIMRFFLAQVRRIAVMGCVLAGCAAPPAAAPVITAPTPSLTTATSLDDLVAPGVKFEPVATGANLMEGPLYLPDGRWIVSEIPANTVWAFDANGNKTALLNPSNNANGHALDANSAIIQAEHGTAAITRIAADGTRTVLADKFEGKRFNSPNDVAIKRHGTLWFTDPTYGLGDRASELGYQGVFRLDPPPAR